MKILAVFLISMGAMASNKDFNITAQDGLYKVVLKYSEQENFQQKFSLLNWSTQARDFEFECNQKSCELLIDTNYKADGSFYQERNSLFSGKTIRAFYNKDFKLEELYRAMRIKETISAFGHQKKIYNSKNKKMTITCSIPSYRGSQPYTCSIKLKVN